MSREDILIHLRDNEAALRAQGVAYAALFGSRARGDETATSDTDILIEIDPSARVGVYEYVRIKQHIAGLGITKSIPRGTNAWAWQALR